MRVYVPSIFLLRVLVIVQVSELYRRTYSTVERNSLILIFLFKLDVHIFLKSLQADHARAFLILKSFSVLFIQPPKYLKFKTSLSLLPPIVFISIGSEKLNAIYSVFFALTAKPTFAASDSTRERSSCACPISLAKSAMSSAKSKSVILMAGCLLLLLGCNSKPSLSSSPCTHNVINSDGKQVWS